MSRIAITRGKVAGAKMAARTLLQVTGLDGEVFGNIELLLPPGYVANPLPASDVLLAEANGVRGHTVALAGDNTGDTVPGLQPGEAGLSRGGRSVLLRLAATHITDPVQIILQAPSLVWTPDGVNFYELATATHTHGGVASGVADTTVPLTAAGMVSG
jgi:phage gp45-like